LGSFGRSIATRIQRWISHPIGMSPMVNASPVT
jgi:hypothetical protein